MATIQFSGETASEVLTTTEFSLPVAMSLTADSPPTQSWMGGQLIDQGRAVEYEGDKPVINPAAMIAGQLYPIIIYGVKAWVVKEADGAVNCYYLEDGE